jgi:hypothetical protein
MLVAGEIGQPGGRARPGRDRCAGRGALPVLW